ncbi:MAG: FAD binding domain-containing protein [Thermoleophilia bacterium]|nr:FAD binding domain-containing protein [Thermoleophilia bacterium]
MHDFRYFAPDTIEEALAFLGDSNGGSRPLAGGTCLIPQMRNRHLGSPYRQKRAMRPECLVSLRRLEELRRVERSGDEWYLGAMTTLARLAERETEADIPVLSQVASGVASPEIRNLATLGGNICNASPAADLLAPLLALQARVHLVSEESERWLPVRGFFRAPHRTALGAGEILAGVGVSVDASASPWGVASYATHSHMGMTLVSATCILEETVPRSRARLVVTPASGRPIELLVDLSGRAERDRETVGDMLGSALAQQSGKVRGCHYAQENPQVPSWYVEHRAVLAAQEAVSTALDRHDQRGSARP